MKFEEFLKVTKSSLLHNYLTINYVYLSIGFIFEFNSKPGKTLLA